jgi:Cu(I)/Ag(I) efflux system membrane fusion protein/cobalt-zinc-cadmium efflux system membrane fusion protein
MKSVKISLVAVYVAATCWMSASIGPVSEFAGGDGIPYLAHLCGSPAHAESKGPKAGEVDPETGKRIKYYVAPMDPNYIRTEPGKSPMGMDLVPVYEEGGDEKEPGSTIRIDPVTMQNMGVRLAKVMRKPLEKTIRTVGYLTYDETKISAVNTKFNGWIEKIYVNFEGERVSKGQPLFDIYSPGLVSAQEEYLLALEQHRTLGNNSHEMIRQGSERLLKSARTRLRYWDMTDAQIERLRRSGKSTKTVTVYSPAEGVVVKKAAFEGHYVKAGENQYEIADLSTIWVDVDVYEYDLPWITRGMSATMELTYVPQREYTGRVLYIYPYLEPKTRTGKLRLQFDNPKEDLKPGMYANVRLGAVLDKNALVIPQEAVIDSGVRKIVFVSAGQGKFRAQEVSLGVEANEDEYQVLEGLEEGDQIVLSAQFMLDSESRLREAAQKMLELQKRAPGGH